MKKTLLCCLAWLFLSMGANAQTVVSPDGKIQVVLELLEQGKPHYRVIYEGQEIVKRSALGVVTNIGDYTQNLALSKGFAPKLVQESYSLRNIKQSQVDYKATEGFACYQQNGFHVM